MSDPCGNLTGRKRSICEGTSGLDEEMRRKYVAFWIGRGEVPPDALDRLPPSEGINGPKAKTRQKASASADNERDNPCPPTARERPCWARWMPLGERVCDTCSCRGTVKTIYFCAFGRGECFEGLGGFRAPAEITSCRYCPDYAPAED